MSNDIEVKQVIEIHPDGKYVFLFAEKYPSLSEYEELGDTISKWWASDEPFLLLSGGIQLVRVDEVGQ